MTGKWVDCKVEGLAELERKLEQLPQKLAAKTIKNSLMAGARIMVSAFVAFAPRLKHAVKGIPTGFLAEHFNIKISLKPEDYAGLAYIGPEGKIDYPDRSGGYRIKTNKKGRKKKVGRIAVASVARYLEFGQRGFKFPFMTPAWESHKQQVASAIENQLAKDLESVAKE